MPPTSLAVLLLHSTDEPDLAVAGLRAARGVAPVAGRSPPLLVLDAEGVRLAAKGVAATLSGGGGRPDVVQLLQGVVEAAGRVWVRREAWRERGYLDDALVPGAELVEADALADLAAKGYVFVTY